MEEQIDTLRIGAFAETAGVNVETIRFYQRKGLLPQPDRPYGSIRRYGEADVARVRFVKSAQSLGFSLDEGFCRITAVRLRWSETDYLDEGNDRGAAQGDQTDALPAGGDAHLRALVRGLSAEPSPH
jgi:hypothetical protein